MKTRSSKGQKEQHRRAVASGVARGKPSKAIAKTIKRTQRTVQRIAQEPATDFLVREIMRPYYARLARLVPKAITAVDGGLTAATRAKKPLHEIRLRAVGRFGTLLQLAQGNNPPESDEHGLVTWEEFVVLYRKRTNAADESSVA